MTKVKRSIARQGARLRRLAMVVLGLCGVGLCGVAAGCAGRIDASPATMASEPIASPTVQALAAPAAEAFDPAPFEFLLVEEARRAVIRDKRGRSTASLGEFEQAAAALSGCEAEIDDPLLRFTPLVERVRAPTRPVDRGGVVVALRCARPAGSATARRLASLERNPESAATMRAQARHAAARRLDVGREPDAFFGFPLAGSTYLTFTPAVGFQVMFFETTDAAWLWRSGDARTIREQWSFQPNGLVCIRHPDRAARRPQSLGGRAVADHRALRDVRRCHRARDIERTVLDVFQGDPYQLASGAAPYRRSRCDGLDWFGVEPDLIDCDPA